MASAGGKDWREGERTMTASRAENRPENRKIQSIPRRRRPLRFFFLDLKSNHRSAAMEAR